VRDSNQYNINRITEYRDLREIGKLLGKGIIFGNGVTIGNNNAGNYWPFEFHQSWSVKFSLNFDY